MSESSPLFDKMDALLARHRGGAAAAEAIPVLLDEADDIPVLTEAVNEVAVFDDVLMFPPEEFFAAEEIVEDEEVQIFEPEPVAAPVVEFLDLPLLDLNALSQANPWGSGWEESPVDLPVAEEISEVEDLSCIQLVSVADEAEWEDEPLFAAIEPELAPAETEPEAPGLSEKVIAELSATVAAQLGVEIATEVEQLTRQHFASLMSTFYEDTLRRLMSDMTIEIEQKLLPRVEELVKEELRKHG
ncbi:hypothetical protein [Iodobacter fluviatilis]|uniref:hypothetical protein n=1 Tax=Iodobacter fluviatilis TaxID=537 RepID=UPI00104B3226|nr:hypothetical protein [Iodobacter fluviatilis]